MKKHLPFARILSVRTKTLPATGVAANRVAPTDWNRLPTETVEILPRLLSPLLKMQEEKTNSYSAVCRHWLPFPSTGERDLRTGQNSRARDEGTILNLMWGEPFFGERVWPLEDSFTCLLLIPEIVPEGSWLCPFQWLATSRRWTQAVVLQSSPILAEKNQARNNLPPPS